MKQVIFQSTINNKHMKIGKNKIQWTFFQIQIKTKVSIVFSNESMPIANNYYHYHQIY
jgi:hypothetical protein